MSVKPEPVLSAQKASLDPAKHLSKVPPQCPTSVHGIVAAVHTQQSGTDKKAVQAALKQQQRPPEVDNLVGAPGEGDSAQGLSAAPAAYAEQRVAVSSMQAWSLAACLLVT